MRHLPLVCLVCAVLLCPAPAAIAQQPTSVRLRIKEVKAGDEKRKDVKIGFARVPRSKDGEEAAFGPGAFKPGLWTPLHITLVFDPSGNIKLPRRRDGYVEGEIRTQTVDSDDLPNISLQPFRFHWDEARDQQVYLTAYVKPSAVEARVSLRVQTVGGQSGESLDMTFPGLPLQQHLYVTIGSRIVDLHDAMLAIAEARQQKPPLQSVAYETQVHRLPGNWRGYDGVDLLILTTSKKDFLDDLLRTENRPRLEALAEWVRRGGRLVVSVAWQNQEKIRDLLTLPGVWQPSLPDILPGAAHEPIPDKGLQSLPAWVRNRANLGQIKAFQAEVGKKDAKGKVPPPPRVAKLRRHDSVEVEVKETDTLPLIVRMPYGLGNVTLLAFDVDSPPFSTWPNRLAFWKALVERFAPRVSSFQEGGAQGERVGADLTSHLHQALDTFDTPPISFGLVALFILLYILVVGPLDYFILKKVFNRLELTWITFPTIVLAISLAAYFTAYAIKGKELKINKVDLVDLDLRSDLDEQGQPRKAYAYGNTWFMLRNPRVQSYTIGIDPVFPRRFGDGNEQTPALVTWLGRPEGGGSGSSGRERSQGLFSRAYEYVNSHPPKAGEAGELRPAGGLRNIMIPVWSTKAFTASWSAPLKRLPFEVSLTWDPEDHNRALTGTIKNNLKVDLEEARLLYGNRWYPLPDNRLPKDETVKITLQQPGPPGFKRLQEMDKNLWAQQLGFKVLDWDPEASTPTGVYDPGDVIRQLLFHEWSDQTERWRNNAQRRLDQSWRLSPDWQKRQVVIADAMLVGRLRRVRDKNGTLTPEEDAQLPTHLWLGAVPGGDDSRPSLGGHLVQDTYIRVFLPVTRARK